MNKCLRCVEAIPEKDTALVLGLYAQMLRHDQLEGDYVAEKLWDAVAEWDAFDIYEVEDAATDVLPQVCLRCFIDVLVTGWTWLNDGVANAQEIDAARS